MTAKQYRPIVLKVIKDGKPFKSAEEFADHLISKMGDYEEMHAIALQELVGTQPAPPAQKEYSGLIVSPIPTMPFQAQTPIKEEDASERFGGARGPAPSKGYTEYRTKDEVFEYYRTNLPVRLQIKPANCPQPITLERRLRRSPGVSQEEDQFYMPTIEVAYGIPGMDDPNEQIRELVSTTDKALDAAGLLKRIADQAEQAYRPDRKRVMPQAPMPLADSLEGLRHNSFGSVETDKDAAPASMGATAAWAAQTNWHT